MSTAADTGRAGRPRRSDHVAVGGHTARVIVILAVNLALAVFVFVYGSFEGSALPSLNTRTMAVGVLPISAAMGLMLACRRIDFALPMVLAFALALATKRFIVFGAPVVPFLTTVGIAAGLGLASALVTWYGRISSALWTGILGFSLWLALAVLKVPTPGPGPWPWPWALAGSLAVAAGGAAVLGLTDLIHPPSLPPIIRAGSRGLPGLALAWVVATVTAAIASLSSAAVLPAERLQEAYPQVLSAAVLGGGFILRGKWGPVAAVGLACAGHLAWALAYQTRLANATADVLVPAVAPLAAIPLYLAIDWVIRRSTGESAPTGLLG